MKLLHKEFEKAWAAGKPSAAAAIELQEANYGRLNVELFKDQMVDQARDAGSIRSLCNFGSFLALFPF